MELEIRNETPADFGTVEALTREAFWNLYVMGCDEHYFLHQLRQSASFVPELDFVALEAGRIVGHIAFMASEIVDEGGRVFDTLTFGPVSVLPECQGRGIGSRLIRHACARAAQLGHKAVVIMGYPEYYKRLGFVSAKDFGVSDEEGRFPYAMQVLELSKGALKGVRGKFRMKFDYAPAPEAVEAFDRAFAPKEKLPTESQRLFAEAVQKYL